MINIKSKLEEGWIHCMFIIEMMGKPKDHLQKTLKDYIKHLSSDKKIEVINEDYATPEQKDDSDMFTIFVELETLMKDTGKVVDFCFDYMPSSVEILGPSNLVYKNSDFSNILNDLQDRLHKVDMVIKNLSQENKVLKKNSAIFLRNIIFLSLKDGKKSVDDLSKVTGVPSKELKKFLDVLIKEKKIIEGGKFYNLS
jgi:hypothetical protein